MKLNQFAVYRVDPVSYTHLGNKEFDEDTEKKGLGTPATRAGIIEKLIYSCLLYTSRCV